MAGEDQESLFQVLAEILRLFPTYLDLTSYSPEGTHETVRSLTTVAICLNMLTLHEVGGRLGPPRSNALVEQVVGAAFQTFAGEDPHPHPFRKAAMLLRGITQGHPFADGNKRTGFLLAMYYLEQAGYAAPNQLPRQEVVDFCMAISAGAIRDVEEIARTLAKLWQRPYP